jgi:hypothetical protein
VTSSSATSRRIAPGGLALDLAKRGAERVLWARVAVQRRVRAPRRHPVEQTPTSVLDSQEAWQASVTEARRLGLPLHHDRPKNWDALGALSVVLGHTEPGEKVLDAGSARYSSVLPWLRLYGYTDLLGLNLEFGSPTTRDGVVFRYGDITATDVPSGSLGAVTCMSVIEHGVPVEAFLRETARMLRPGGVLVVSTDYDADPPDTTGKVAYGQPVRIFGPAAVRQLIAAAEAAGLSLLGSFEPQHAQRPVHWKRQELDYTFIRLSFVRS